MALQWLPCQAPGVIGPVSVYCDWVRWKVWSATSVSAWQHVKLSEQIRPWDTLACCWDVKQPTNKLTPVPVCTFAVTRTCMQESFVRSYHLGASLSVPFKHGRLVGRVVKVSASRAEGPGFKSRLCGDFFGVKSYQWLKHWHSAGYPARRLAL